MGEEEVRVVQPDNPAPMWYENITLDEAERFITSNLQSAVRNVIAIGYYLKNIRDNGLFREAGCENIWDYAWERFGFSKSTASRYMTRNDRFSRGGNSPILDEKYRDFNKSQLQEMLSLTDSELEQVTPDMTVRQIREIHRPAEKPVPYVALPGQIELEDLLAGEALATLPVTESQAPAEAYTVSVEDMLGEEVVAMSQQMPEAAVSTSSEPEESTEEIAAEPLSAYGTPKRVYPPDSLISEAGCEGGMYYCFDCAMDCRIRQKDRHCREAPLGNPFPCEVVKGSFTELPEGCQFVNHDLAYHCAGSGEPSPCCKDCQDPCEYICGRAMKALDQETKETLQAEKRTEPEEEDEDELLCDNCQNASILTGNVDLCAGCRDGRNYKPLPAVAQEVSAPVATPQQKELSDMDLLRSMLEKEKNTLEEMLKVNEADPHPDLKKMIRKKKLLVGALAEMLCDLEQPELPEKEDVAEQPDLPNLKNNDQRKQFLETFRDWPVWFDVPEAAEVYYRYDLPDGCSLVICEYHYWVGWLERYGDGPECTGTREYMLTPGYHYLNDCKSNRSEMVEKLKEIQKGGKG